MPFSGVTNVMPETPISGRAVDVFRSLSIRRRFQDFKPRMSSGLTSS